MTSSIKPKTTENISDLKLVKATLARWKQLAKVPRIIEIGCPLCEAAKVKAINTGLLASTWVDAGCYDTLPDMSPRCVYCLYWRTFGLHCMQSGVFESLTHPQAQRIITFLETWKKSLEQEGGDIDDRA